MFVDAIGDALRYMSLKTENCYLKIFVKIYVGKKMSEKMSNYCLKTENSYWKTQTKHPLNLLLFFFFFLPLKLLNLTITTFNYCWNPNLNGRPMWDWKFKILWPLSCFKWFLLFLVWLQLKKSVFLFIYLLFTLFLLLFMGLTAFF